MQKSGSDDLAHLSAQTRRRIVKMIHLGRSSHVGSSLSTVDLLVVLYTRILQVNPCQPKWLDRDRFILSKGHGCAALYAVLAEQGFFPGEWLDTFYQDGSSLPGHATHTVPGVEVSTGALGHGLAIAAGMALAGKREGAPWRVFVMLSDGECDEGATWEAALFAAHHRLDNLTVIVDYNKMQAMGHTHEVLSLDSLSAKWCAFGWAVREIDGHDLEQIEAVLRDVPFCLGKPSCVVAHTVKGKGVSFMEDELLWHYRSPQGEEYAAALAELEFQS